MSCKSSLQILCKCVVAADCVAVDGLNFRINNHLDQPSAVSSDGNWSYCCCCSCLGWSLMLLLRQRSTVVIVASCRRCC